MTAHFLIRHNLQFRYDAPVGGSVTTLHVSPVRGRRQVLHDISIRTDPPGAIFEFTGPFGNRGHFFDRHGRHRRLAIRVRSSVEVAPPAPLPAELAPDSWEALRKDVATPDHWLMLQPSRFVRMSPSLARFVSRNRIGQAADLLTTIRQLRSTLYSAFEYAPGSTVVDSPIEHILEAGRGVCQDYAHVMASILRSWGVPTRYASGYLGPDGNDDQHSQSHAWVEPWLPGFGWRGFDPANDCDCDERHIRVAVGRDYADVPPVRGTFRGNANSTLQTEVSVTRQEPDPNDS
ncbi:MAG: transglutaminase family protein [Gemmatimonadetes bacterium]|nr:transglutaminase family protein [Gemmatimonadota bacterium]MXX72973.1 transglutaminase family protein [Gemmatimonadota bacterium]MYC91334.1 transglutaminase family protein [Gemmatimonadota bacterium]MYG37165.1 transglutaminase family protein [Gemmatimonadota bacterium]MYJ18127.1 transglutaminase family protein [Gemmatimonadota bacterium]